MRIPTLWIIAIASCLGACGEQPPPEPQPAAEAEEPMTTARTDIVVDDAFINHMHAHADRMDDLMFALDDGDLDAARTPAYWLSRHEEVSGLPDDLQPYVAALHDAASAVELASDIDAARVAADEIMDACQGCHHAAGVHPLD